MLRKLNFLLLSILMTASYSFAQSGLGSIKGTVNDADTKEVLPFCKVVLFQSGNIRGGATTDFDGKFQINSIGAGTYDVEVRNEAEGYQPVRRTGVIVSSEKITFLDDITMSKAKGVKEIQEVKVVAYRVPLIDKDGGSSGATVTREDISRLPVRSAAGVASTVGGVNTDEGSGAISVRGSREDASYYYIDGIKVRGSSNLPKSAIEEVSVITGGLPANYGDVTGGVISVTTRGPSAKYFGSVEGVSSGFYLNGADKDGYDGKVIGLDKFGYNLLEGMFSGPLWMQKDSTGAKVKPRLGFLVSANYTNEKDSRPLAGGSYRVKKDVRDDLIANPLRLTSNGDGTFNNSSFLRTSDFEKVDWRMNAGRSVFSAQAKIDVNTGPSTNLTFGGSMNYNNSNNYSYYSSLMNFSNFGVSKSLDWRVFGRLTQRFTNNEEGSSSKIKSFNYSLMVDYSKSTSESYDPKHGFNLFNYGHVGTYDSRYDVSYQFNDDKNLFEQTAVPFQAHIDFTPSSTNPQLAAITNQYYSLLGPLASPLNDPFKDNLTLRQGNALLNGDVPKSVYSIWDNIGTPYNGFGKFENDQLRGTGSFSVNIGDHSVSFGFELEQRWDRGWTSGTTTSGNGNGPIGLWQMARQLTNSHISELDLNSGVVSDSGSFKYISYSRLNTGNAYTTGTGAYGGQENADNQSFFDYNLRNYLYSQGLISQGGAGSDFINIDKYDPSIYKFDMFSPDELLNSGNSFVSYWGFDHTGQKVSGTTDINKYFNEFDKNGNYKRFVGAFQPTYISGYIMDKFAFKDIVFNVGLRVDVFDANQPVLKDPFLFYSARTVAEAKALAANDPSQYGWVNIPEGMGDDYTVYVNDVNNPTAINGYRIDRNWYNASGTPIEDPTIIEGASGIAPWLLNPNQKSPSAEAFKDYEAQINPMPRVAFSFPISDEASFFAHYDILTQRPTSGFRFDPFQYQFLRSATINNANLKASTTIDYELGFQQVLSKSSSLKISAFYREQRNNIQLVNMFNAYPQTYATYGNIDFGTVKGMTVSYDLRRTGNIRLTANYTLQFAEGTGSSSTSSSSLINAGVPNLRSIFPYSYDQRHAINVTFDYRYGTGKDYNGPVIAGVNIFENTGLNIITNLYSGSPYSSQTTFTDAGIGNIASTLNGTTQGSRTPWSYRLDLQLDKTFELAFGKEGKKKKAAALNVYLRVTNLFNQFNVLEVYRATGNTNDDGYLAAALNQASIQNQLDEQSFRDYYTMKIQNPFNVSSPRTIRLGVKFDF